MNLQRCYTLLGLNENDTVETLKTQYRRLAFKYHPDLNQNDPQAGQKFQEINEAYLTVQKAMQNGTKIKFTNGKTQTTNLWKRTARPQNQKQQTETQNCTEKREHKKSAHFERPEKQQRKWNKNNSQKPFIPDPHKDSIFQDLLKDPFAKKVYEDIFFKLKNEKLRQKTETKTQKDKSKTEQEPNNTATNFQKEHTDDIKSLSLKQSVFFRVQNWLHNQADIRETIYLPAQKLLPGSTILITVKQPFTQKPITLDIRLPYDFAVGRILRLKKKGKNLGFFKGDLYLQFLPK